MAPKVSILMAARNAGAHIDSAIASARAQSASDIELLVLNDGSTDDTKERALRHAAEDERVRVIDGPATGLADNRNKSLEMAASDHALILDSDDILRPDHVALLLEAAHTSGAEIVAPNMISFAETDESFECETFLNSAKWRGAHDISFADFISHNHMNTSEPALGYLKPMFDMRFLKKHGIRYKPSLSVGEDYDIVEACLLKGARYAYCPETSYFYRRHEASTSHRISENALMALIREAEVEHPGCDEEILALMLNRQKSLTDALSQLQAMEALKKLNLPAFIQHALESPQVPGLIFRSLREAVTKRVSKKTNRPTSTRQIRALSLCPDSKDRLLDSLKAFTSRGLTLTKRPADKVIPDLTSPPEHLENFAFVFIDDPTAIEQLHPLTRFTARIVAPIPGSNGEYQMTYQGFSSQLTLKQLVQTVDELLTEQSTPA